MALFKLETKFVVVDALPTEPDVVADNVGTWIETQCRTPKEVKTALDNLYANYRIWCEGTGHEAFFFRKFSMILKRKGHASYHSNSIVFKLGIRAKTTTEKDIERDHANREIGQVGVGDSSGEPVVDALRCAADLWPLQPGDIGLVYIENPIGPDHQDMNRKVVIVEDDCTPKVDRSRHVIARFLDEPDGYEHLFHRWRIRPIKGPSPVAKEPSPVERLQTVQGPGRFGLQSRDVFVPTFTRDEQHAMALQLTLTFQEARPSPRRSGSLEEIAASLAASGLDHLIKIQGATPAAMGRRFWVFRDRIYSTAEQFTPEEMTALIVDADNRKKARIERALNKAAQRPPGTSERRLPIPHDVKMFVWQRDGGCCVKCGRNRNLEFDHIIPLALGGSNTARNIQLLCEDCNRAKGASLV